MKNRSTAMRLLLAALLICGILAPTPTDAGVSKFCRAAMARLMVAIEPNLANRTVEIRVGNPYLEDLVGKEPRKLVLGRYLGRGADGTGYLLENPKDWGIDWDGQVAVRIPHAYSKFPKRIRDMKTGTVDLESSRQFLLDKINDIAASPEYPDNPSWGQGEIPFLPFVRTEMTDCGPLSFSPLVNGMELAEIRKNYPNGLAQNMRESLKDLFALSSAIHDAVEVPDLLRANGYTDTHYNLDLIPRNLVWIEISKNPQLANHLKLKKDSFISYEANYSSGANYYRPTMTYEEYEAFFISGAATEYLPWLQRLKPSPTSDRE